MTVRTMICGGCELPYSTQLIGPDSAVCPRCNPGRTFNRIAEFAETTTLAEFADAVCRDLPEGWSLTLSMENGAGDFTLCDPRCREVDPEEYTSIDRALIARGCDAVVYAMSFVTASRVRQ